jgi:TPR repeat protein
MQVRQQKQIFASIISLALLGCNRGAFETDKICDAPPPKIEKASDRAKLWDDAYYFRICAPFGSDKDFKYEREVLEKLVSQGDARAMYELGNELYFFSKRPEGKPEDARRSAELLKMASDRHYIAPIFVVENGNITQVDSSNQSN